MLLISFRTVAAAVAATFLAFGGMMFVATPTASAATNCYGTRIDTMPMRHGTSTAGRVELWYSGANGGTNCVIVYDVLAGSHTMGAYIDRGDADSGGWDKSDVDYYQYYAGPVLLYNMSRTCVSWGGNMYVGGNYYSAFRFNTHCG